MSLKDKLSNILKVSEDEYYDSPELDEYDEYEEEEDEAYEPAPRFNPRAFKESRAEQQNSKVVSINASSKLQVVLTKPKSIEDSRAVADSLNQKKTVVLNLESVRGEDARRILDFLSGVTYANRGTMRQVANNTFMITPYNVDVNGDLISELGNNGLVFEK
ncbi:MAG: cell division protein SepF [Clostridia bacterium]|nr:cell division protein SepF [Clostridia bacterium]